VPDRTVVGSGRSRDHDTPHHVRPTIFRGVNAAARRISWGLADQAVSSITNFAVGIVVARSLGATGFGIFTLVWVTYGVVLNVSRGLATDPLTVRFSGVDPASWRAAVARTSGTAVLVGGVTGGMSLLLGAILGGPAGAAFVSLGLVLPALLLQDSWRFAFFAAGVGRKAFTNDLVWAVALVPALIGAANGGTVTGFVLAWGLSGAVAAAYGCVQTRLRPRPTAVLDWLRQQRDLGLRYLVENVTNSGGQQLRMYGLGAIAGLADVGAVRGAQLLLGPFLAVLMGLSLVAVPEAARVLRRSRHRVPQFCLFLGGGQAGAALAWGLGLLFLLPEEVGRFALGSVWPAASMLILPTTLSVMNASLSSGAAAGLRALGAARRSLRAQLVASAAYVTGGLVGAALAGALGSSWGVALGSLFGVAIWWWQLVAGLRELDAMPPKGCGRRRRVPARHPSRPGRSDTKR
jgi:O-antigen/teichoic acid export membrane protein